MLLIPLFVVLCVKFDPGTHKRMHSVLAKKLGVTVVLKQVTEGKEHIITYLSRCLIDAKTRYSFIEKLCLSLFYACSKLWHYLLSSTCVVACHVDVIRHML
jgi:hypothetical protein